MPVPPALLTPRAAWVQLLALAAAFSMSQAFRTAAAVLATPLQAELGLSAQALGLLAGTFHFAFAGMQLFMGVGIDLHGVRRTVLTAFPLAVVGALVSALAGDWRLLVLGQALIGVGCAPAFLVCTVFIARHFPPHRFAAVSGLILGLGGVGMLLTGTPLAWLVQTLSWRAGFGVMAVGAALAWGLIAWLVHEPARAASAPRETLRSAVAGFGALFRLPYTWGIVALGLVTYASFLALRGLWLGPLLIGRHGFSLIDSGHVLLAVSVVSLFGPPLFGRLDPGPATRRRWLAGFTLLMAGQFVVLGLGRTPALDIADTLVLSLLSGYMVLQYADVRSAYPAALTGRAMAVFTMALFLGAALMQALTGLVASHAAAWGVDTFVAVPLTLAVVLTIGTLAFVLLPRPPQAA